MITASLLSSLLACLPAAPLAPVKLRLPPLPAPWAAAGLVDRWLLVYPAAGGGYREREVAAGTAAEITDLATAPGGAVTAYPLIQGSREGMRPAGGFTPPAPPGPPGPPGAAAPRLSLSWEAGAAAEMLLALQRKNPVYRRINHNRLVAEMMEKSGGDPWRIMREPLRRELARLRFNAALIRAGEVVTPDKARLPEGRWISADPFRCGRESIIGSKPGTVLYIDRTQKKALRLSSESGRALTIYTRPLSGLEEQDP